FLEGDNNKYIIKCIKKSDQWDDDVAQLEHEYNLLLNLNEKFDHFPKVFEFVDLEKHSGIVFKNENLVTLDKSYDKKNVTLKNFFPLAISLAHAVSEIHSLNIIHKNLNPKCIFYCSEDLMVKVGNFSIATKLKRTMVPTAPPSQLQGSLEYMAPEQTGRMNRPLTLRADLYSLGIIYYEMLTGSAPYISDEPMKIIFGHIANVPQAPHKINEDIPPVLSDIVMKLLSKMAEDRYKSAIGLANDLEKAWSEFKKNKEITPFPIGQCDIPTQLELPQKLYGRDEEIRLLETSFNKLLKTSETKLIIVKGYSGIGKTSLIRELTQKVAIAKGIFASGKFNKFQKSDSYEGLRQALDQVINQYLTLPQEDYERFKEELITHCGSLLSVIADFIPRVKKIVGEQKTLPEVGIEQTKNRFELAIYQFLQVCSMNHPIVLFLDDLQWANNAMISMLEKFYLSKELKNVLMIISFRSNEVSTMHPLAIFLEKMEEKKPYTKIFLEGLGKQALIEILRDMLYLPVEDVESLAAVVERKTEGNPFFLLMLLEELYRDGELAFSSKKKRWVWDENRIVKIAASENVLDFVYRRLEKLPEESMETLHLAACIGHTFSLEELKLAQESSVDFILDSLKPAIKDGLIIPSNLKDEWVKVVKEDSLLNREYHFQHDKIHHSAYRKKTPEETKKMHLRLARNWYESYKKTMDPNRLMSIADQYNKGVMYVVDDSEKFLICELNHESGKLALDSVAYETAYLYDRMAKETIDPNNWEENYSFMFDLHLSFIKSSFMAHRYDESEKASEELLDHANNNLDKAAILAAKGYLQRAQGRMEGNIPLFAEGLKLLNYESLGRDPNIFQIIYNIVRFKFKIKRNKKDFSNLPEETDDHQLLIYRLAEGIGEECYYQGNILRFAYVPCNYFLKLFKNHSILTAYKGYAFYCVMWPRTHFAHELGKKVMKLLNEFENNEITSNILLMMNSLHSGWHQPWKQITKLFQRSARHSMEVGNLEFAGISYLNVLLFDQTITCDKGKSELPKIADFISEISPRCYVQSKIYQQFYRNLCGDVQPNSWKTEDFDEDAELKLMERMHYSIGINKLMINKLRVALHYGDCSLVVKEKDFLYSRMSKIKRANQPLDSLYSHLFVFMV
ncbi:MAG: AAA family ATPase, partial [Chlamydiota bacterium]